MSGWEIGIENSAARKAEEDYGKRTADPLDLTLRETTFVFVTPRSWPGREKWVRDKRAAGLWKDIRVIGAAALEQWIDSAPAVALWLAKHIGKVVPGGIRDIESAWEEWSLATNPTMTTDVVISGRTKEVERVHQWMGQGPGVLEVQGDSPDEAFAFLYAAIAALPENERVKAFARCIVVENINELRACLQTFQNPLIIAAPGQCVEAAGTAIAKGHQIFLSMDAKVIDIGRILRLSRPQHSIVENNLRHSGLSAAKARRLARDFGRSIPVLRRHLYQSHAVSAPAWARADAAQLLLPVLFAGAWTDEKDGDRTVLEALSGMRYGTFIKQLEGLLAIEDSPIRKIGRVWMLKSPLDAWFLLARHLNDDSLKLFQQSIYAVLTETDPKYDLPAEKRWAASMYGKSSQYSEWLRSGLVESLVLLAVYGDRPSNATSTQGFVDRVVKEIFAAAQTWEAWASLKDVTPLLAEAAPDTFMETVDQGLINKPALFQEIMRDEGGALLGECRHSGLLWALESAAWSSEYFARAVRVVSGLTQIDPGGTWGNRPRKSLKEIFWPGLPQTYATPEQRLAALDTLIAKDPQMVWQFAHDYYHGGSIGESHRFRWRDSGGERGGLDPEKNEDYRAYVQGLLPKLRDVACARENVVMSADTFVSLPADIQDQLLHVLETIDPAVFSREERDQLLHNIRKALNWINSYGEEDRRVHIPALNRILGKFVPEDVLERVGWLLSNPWPSLPQGEPENYEAHQTAITLAREEAAREVLDMVPLGKILDYAGTIGYVGVLGHALGKVIHDEQEDAAVLDAILGRMINNPGLITGYALGRIEAAHPDWIIGQIKRMKVKGNYSPEACALLYLGLPEGTETWSAVRAHGEDVERAYWTRARGYSRADQVEAAPIAIEKLLDVKRPAAALYIAGQSNVSVPSSLLKRLLEAILSLDPEQQKLHADVMTAYHLGHVFRQLYERNELPIEEIASLEWPFGALFDDLSRYTSSPLAIHRVLQRDPSWFAQLIGFMYKRDDHAPDPSREAMDDEHTQRTGRNAHEVLESWRLMPGLQKDGSVDEQELIEWVEAARRQCAASSHVTGGDLQIAFMLAHAPADDDGTWPHIAIRNLIERLNNEIIDTHIPIGVYNSRGVVSRALNDGGGQERGLSEGYKKMSDAVRAKWLRTAVMLRSLAKTYERDAQYEDISSDLRDLRWS